jgi:two-component system CheB/CheR fusion protein
MSAKKPRKKATTDPAASKPAREPVKVPEQPEKSTPLVSSHADENAPPRSGPPVVGMGASAGGLDAFKRFFTAMPADSGIAFVLVPHLDPAHESLMVELLARHTVMPVVEARNDMPVEANHVYIIPPNKYMKIRHGTLRLTGPVEPRSSQTSIDLFLRSLADDQQERAICVIFSGTGSHGSLGLRAIKAAGGMAMVQDPATAEYDRMPESAIATGLADYVLAAEQMPEALIKYVHHAYLSDGARIDAVAEATDQLLQVLSLLRARSKFDFRAYRKKMLARRIERRMGLNHLDKVPDYIAYLRDHPEELKLLIKDLFINVTNFFRDPDAFEEMEKQVIAPLVQSKQDDSAIRVWVPGCSTGEEPYSIAMLLSEHLAAAHKGCRIQIFATDVDEDSLAVARQGLYPESIAADLSPERLSRFFNIVDERGYQINKKIREMVIFASQNLINDATFTKLDFISCRNVLIYLESEVQKKVITLFHFALNERGYLFLGPSETIGRQIDLFEPMSKKWRIYRRIGPTRPERVDFPIVAVTATRGPTGQPTEKAGALPMNFAEVTQRLLLDEFAPAAVLINRKYEVLYYFGPCSEYLEFPAGQPTHNLILIARDGLRTKLRGAVHRAISGNEPVVLTNVQVKRSSSYYPIRVAAKPVQVPQAAEGLLLVTFSDEAPPERPPRLSVAKARARRNEEDRVRQIEYELKATREDLQSTIEELESSNEELKASNEEAMSMNEELQSANEELETSKEELQSLNEELTTVNNQLQERIDELEKTNDDMANLLQSTDIATVFLNQNLRIKLFTAPATNLFNLIASDVGRPIGDITAKFDDPELLGHARQVLQLLTPRDKEVAANDGSWWIRRINPYRTQDNRIEGIVITFVNITERRRTAEMIRHIATIVEASADAIFSKDLDGIIRTWNRGAERLYGYTSAETIGRSVEMLIPADRAQEFASIMSRLRRGEYVEQLETERVCKDGRRVVVSLTVSPIHNGDGKVVSASVTARDITDRKHAEQELELQAQMAVNLAEGVSLVRARDAVIVYTNERFEEMFQYGPGELIGKHVRLLNAGEQASPGEQIEEIIRALRAKKVWAGEVQNVKKDGTTFWTYSSVSTFEHPKFGEVWIGAVTDITKRKAAELAMHESEERLRAILDAASDAIITIDHDGIIRSVNAGTERMFGYAAAEMLGQNVTMLMPSPFREAHDGFMTRYRQTREKHIIGTTRQVDAQRKDGSVFPSELTVTEIEHLGLFTGIHRDLTERNQLELDVVEAASREQRRIGEDLHDSVAQELTALSLTARDLVETVRTDPDKAAELAERMSQGLQRSQTDLRAVLLGLVPVAVDHQGLMAALADLAEGIQQEGSVACKFDCPEPVFVTDNTTATQLYLIAQEAVHNALKHGKPRNVRIFLESNEHLVLQVRCDGIGMPDRLDKSKGLGLRIMRNRAAIIGAKLTIEPAKPTGTVVTCLRARKGHE